MNVPKAERRTVEEVSAVFSKHAGNIRASAKELGIARSSVRRILKSTGLMKKPLAGGTVQGNEVFVENLPTKGKIRRYILTSAQNNTYVHEGVWNNLLALAEHYGAEILIGTYTYNQNHYGKLSVKRGTDKHPENELWYDPKVQPYFADKRIQLAPGLVWCGEYNALPTNVNPLASLESYTGRKSAVFPHAKLAMRSVPTFQGEGVKLNYTTGTVTQRNYIQKREGVIAEFHHIYGALLVEVNSDGNWWVRQLNYDEGTGTVQDLQVLAKDGEIVIDGEKSKAPVEAITWGDLHGTMADEKVVNVSLTMLDTLQPKYQFLHDVLQGTSINRHVVKNGAKNSPHYTFHRWLRGLHRVDEEFRRTAEVIKKFFRPGTLALAPDANHDGWWLNSWLNRYDYRVDPANAEFYLDLQNHVYKTLRAGQKDELMPRDINMMQYAFSKFGVGKSDLRFLLSDESFKTCDGKIENGMHGHLGPKGTRGTPENLAKMGRKANTAHTHAAGIYNGLYVAGTTSKLKWTYNWGPSDWTHSHIVTYPNGKRSIITIYADKWRA